MGRAPKVNGIIRSSGRRSGETLLSPTERAILDCYAQGFSPGETAAELGLRSGKVSAQMVRLRDRLGLVTMVQLYLLAGECGFASVPYVPGLAEQVLRELRRRVS